MLDKQVSILSLDTGNFYSGLESRLHRRNHELRRERNVLVNGGAVARPRGGRARVVRGVRDVEKDLAFYGIGDDGLSSIRDGGYDFSAHGGDESAVRALGAEYAELKRLVAMKNAKIKETKDRLLTLLSNKVEENIRTGGRHHVRHLRDNEVSQRSVISVFDSYFTRTIGAKPDEFCDDFMVVQVYYFDVVKDLIYHGFTYKGEKYVYFTSSAGQIRTKKCVFVKESVWKEHEKTIMCGLTVGDINARGGNNPNKHLAYLALANSATDVWEGFDIEKTIVIDDFATEVYGTYDFIDDTDYTVTRTSGHAEIEHTDGAGMMLPNAFGAEQSNKMVRLPWIKGLLGVFDFRRFVEVNGCSPVIKDVYGKEHDIVAEDIQVVFTKSQFKMWKYYDSWGDYKNRYKGNGCAAGVTNIEEERIKDATINYQMLQSLTDVSDDEIFEIAKPTVDRLNNLCSSVDNIKRVMGVTPYNQRKTYFQRAIELYPDILNDKYAKEYVKNVKDKMVRRGKAGKLNVHGKYTFVLPDFYAACQHWFAGIENPDGLLDDGEVFCWLFRKNAKLDCLRSPHLYREHPVRKNVACREYGERQSAAREWFCTNAVYTSCKDLISRILQFDVDGDKLLVVADEKLIEVAERNMHNITPLYYNMRKAEPSLLCNETIYGGLNAAFTGGNIGIYSNNISKIWNSNVFSDGDDDEKRDAIDVIKLLCMENNYTIDYAKTLYKPKRPKRIDDRIMLFTKEKLPHFFKYAKDKDDGQIVDANSSFVNKLEGMIPNPKINCRKLGLEEIDYRLMMSDPETVCKVAFADNGRVVKDGTDPLIVRYCDFDREYYFSVDAAISCDDDQQSTDRFAKKAAKHRQMADRIKYELSQFGYDDRKVADILVSFLYNPEYGKNRKNKTALWMCYGDYIVENLEKIFKPQTKAIQCVDCGEWFEVNVYDSETCRCGECVKEHKKALRREQNRRAYEKRKNSVAPLSHS